MKGYSISLRLEGLVTEEKIQKILKLGTQLGFKYSANGKNLTLVEAIEEGSGSGFIGCDFDNVTFGFFTSSMSFYVSDHSFNWKTNFKNIFIPDNITALNLLLDLTDKFVVRSIRIRSYLQLLEWPKEERIIIANSLLSKRNVESNTTDGCDLFVSALVNNYIFIKSPREQTELFIDEVSDMIDNALIARSDLELFLKVEGYIMTLKITERTVGIIPLEPFKIKKVDDQEDIDRAFYTRILLNLLETFGIDELICSL